MTKKAIFVNTKKPYDEITVEVEAENNLEAFSKMWEIVCNKVKYPANYKMVIGRR